MDIKERLRLIDSINRKIVTNADNGRPHVPTTSTLPLPGLERRENDKGVYHYIEKQYPNNYSQGAVVLSELLQHPPKALSLVGLDDTIIATDLSKLLFIDTETTGLAGGAGTYVFLAGVGYFKDGVFKLVQFFMSDFNEEAAFLQDLNELVNHFEVLVSYNGKSFDGPLLTSRSIMQGFSSRIASVPHFDLLHAVRRLWKHRLIECNLGNAEHALAGNQRTGDVPGFMIPALYFEFLRNRDITPLEPVMYHNRQDILSMVAILKCALDLLASPLDKCQTVADFLPVARLLERMGRFSEVVGLCRQFLNFEITPREQNQIRFYLSFIYKRMKMWDEAAEVWHHLIEHMSFHPLLYIELAKHYEHRKRRPDSALMYVRKALSEFAILDTLGARRDWIELGMDLKQRLVRLEKKVQVPATE